MAWSKQARQVAEDITCNIPGIASPRVAKPRVTIPRAPKAPKGIKGLHTKVGGVLKQSSKGVGKIQKTAAGIRGTKLGQRAPRAGVIKQPKVAAAVKPRKLYSTAPRQPTKGSFTKGDKRFAGIQAKRAALRSAKAPAAPAKVAAPTKPRHSEIAASKSEVAKLPYNNPKSRYYREAIKAHGHVAVATAIRKERGMKPLAADHPYMKKYGSGKSPAAGPAKGSPGRFSPSKPSAPAAPAASKPSSGSQHHYFRVKLKNGKMGTARAKGANQADAARRVAKHGVTPAGYIGGSSQKHSARDVGKQHIAASKPPTAKLLSRDNGPATSIAKAPAHKYKTGSNKWAKQKLSQAGKKVGGWLKKKLGIRNAQMSHRLLKMKPGQRLADRKGYIKQGSKLKKKKPGQMLREKFGIRNSVLTGPQATAFKALAPLSRKTNGLAFKALTGRNPFKKKPGRIERGVTRLFAGNQKGKSMWSEQARQIARQVIENAKKNTARQTKTSQMAAKEYRAIRKRGNAHSGKALQKSHYMTIRQSVSGPSEHDIMKSWKRRGTRNAKRNNPKQTIISRRAARLSHRDAIMSRDIPKHVKRERYKENKQLARMGVSSRMSVHKKNKCIQIGKHGKKLKKADLDNPKHIKALLKVFG